MLTDYIILGDFKLGNTPRDRNWFVQDASEDNHEEPPVDGGGCRRKPVIKEHLLQSIYVPREISI